MAQSWNDKMPQNAVSIKKSNLNIATLVTLRCTSEKGPIIICVKYHQFVPRIVLDGVYQPEDSARRLTITIQSNPRVLLNLYCWEK